MPRWFRIQDLRLGATVAWGRAVRQPRAPGQAIIAVAPGAAGVEMFGLGSPDASAQFRIHTRSHDLVVSLSQRGAVELATFNADDPRQLWRWGAGRRLINQHSGRGVNRPAAGASLSALDAGEFPWAAVAAGPPDNTPVALQNSSPESMAVPLVAAIQLAGPAVVSGMSVMLGKMTAAESGRFWRYNSENGTIARARNPQLLLTATSGGPVLMALLPSDGTPLPTQQWSFDGPQWDVVNGAIVYSGSTDRQSG